MDRFATFRARDSDTLSTSETTSKIAEGEAYTLRHATTAADLAATGKCKREKT